MSWERAVWKKGKKTIKGSWIYIWHKDRFFIDLDGKDPETGLSREVFELSGDRPEFGGWKLVERKKKS